MFEKLGGDADRLVVRKSNDPVKIFDYIGGDLLEMIQDGAPIKCIVIDSIKSIRYPKDVRKQTTDQIMGGSGSQYLGSALKLVVPVIAEHKLLTFFIQQVTAQLDPMKALRNPYVISEGHALKHAADLMLEITRVDSKKGVIESGETITGAAAQVGHKVRVKVKKNRMGAPARQAEFAFHYDLGVVDTGGEIFELAKALGVIKHPVNPETGRENVQMWAFGNDAPVRGEQNMKNLVVSDSDLQRRVLDACYQYQDVKVDTDSSGFVEDEAL
jgi:RecA/RadA recombinase